ncbi:TRAP transporter small permease [Halopelagius longus]|uniref:TRAP transporter small permease n=1 Tax=Halopelagius longus TaxID=1236180 RepID=A0A1H1FE20_9EURY|nr:TRAP transporter small permease subunit [Halopelagius longus]RDI70155.1 TRAP transporter small permease [Halopelagius longus]SDQ98959.1 TRAP-type C4-dicarboxylate transport system, small permease component [Halopelagius longus]
MVETNENTSPGRYFDGAVRAVALSLYVLMILVVGLQILTRWVIGSFIGSSLPWTVNLSQMLLVAVTFIGAAVASGKREHISLDLLVSRLSDDTIRALTALRTILVLAFVGVMVSGAYPLYQQNRGSVIGALPAHAPFTQAWLYVPVVVGGVVIAVYGVRDLWAVVASPETILEDMKRGDDDEN